ncbi:hypothetical protein ACVIWV_006179 [Bradyrhizobium diazoefficiens]|nr:hypothetical protein [Bradyrhizobium diazoefficiens]MBR0920611.1 hypothetical protein [Bradyrhizobium diazoefficiens]WLA66042.1 hypothetical protein QNN01_04015 [Bradyrhizobium diazoefficiens]
MTEDQRVTAPPQRPVGASQGLADPGGASGAPGGNAAPAGADGGGRGQLLTSNLAGRLLMVSAERVRQLAREGWIEKQGKDQFYLVDVVQGYIRFRNDADRRAQKSAADSRVRDARAREIELRNAVREGRLIEIDEAMAIVEQITGLFRAETAGLPARVTRDLQFRKTIETALNDILERVADIAAERGRAVASARVASETVAANAARRVGGDEPHLSTDSRDPRAA